MKKHTLQATKRTVTGKKVKTLRAKGEIPGTIYGRRVKSVSVSVSIDAFKKTYTEAGETGLVELTLEKEVRPVLIHRVDRDPVDSRLLHIEFFQVDLKEKVHTKVPLEVSGESPAVAQKLGVILTTLNEVEVEALPADLPEKIVVDVSQLAAVGDELKVSDLKVPSGVTITTAADLTVVKVGALVSKEAEAQAAQDEAAAAEAQAQAAPTEGAQAAPTEEKSPEAPKEKAQ